MHYDLPNNGCNYLNNNATITNYYNGTATTYVLLEGEAIRSRTSTYTTMPTGIVCMDDNSIPYRNDLMVEWQIWSIILCLIIGALIYKTIGRILGK